MGGLRRVLLDGHGPEPHGSFYEKMYDFYAGFHALDRPRCETRREWDAKVEDAWLASLRGEVDRPPAVFTDAARFGRDRVSFLNFQMRTLSREEHEDPFYRLLTHGETRSWTLDEDLFAAHEQVRRFGSAAATRCSTWPCMPLSTPSRTPGHALVHWRPLHEDHLAPIALLADPRAARLITPERGREPLATKRG
ncbi:hypothetical protein ACIBQ1_37645 [Nonomuraea sp. NPDC050153]|uniref:hypothetical protein n=1 Tax=Nonomuraea sp. NPDC050153 TaxID=3364359 RepID=UPI0037A6CF1F